MMVLMVVSLMKTVRFLGSLASGNDDPDWIVVFSKIYDYHPVSISYIDTGWGVNLEVKSFIHAVTRHSSQICRTIDLIHTGKLSTPFIKSALTRSGVFDLRISIAIGSVAAPFPNHAKARITRSPGRSTGRSFDKRVEIARCDRRFLRF
jgi:hypothetical protein